MTTPEMLSDLSAKGLSGSAIEMSPAVSPVGDVLRAWLRLANMQFSPRLTSNILTQFKDDPVRVFNATDDELDTVPGLMARHVVRLRDEALDVTDRQWSWYERHSVHLVTRSQSSYPAALRDIPDAPPMFFYRGSLSPADEIGVGIVGSRRATPYGRAVSDRMARELSERGVTVVSGGAIGIDTAAHKGAVEAGGRTLAVLGCGLDVDYPRENRALFEKVVESGAVISEYPLGAQPEAWRFPLRNRLISGLSLGSLVVEAPRQSGALITARFAAEQGRTLMVIPANIDRPSSAGSNDLLKLGAVPVTETEDIFHALGLVVVPARTSAQFTLPLDIAPSPGASPTTSPSGQSQQLAALAASLPESQRQLLACISQTPRHMDAIAREAGLSTVEAGVEMTMLELTGLVVRLPGNCYIRHA